MVVTFLFQVLTLAQGPYAAGEFLKGSVAYEQRNCPMAESAWRRAAESGHLEAQYRLAQLRREGRCSPVYTDFVYWSRRAANGGHSKAQQDLAVEYAVGDLIPADTIESLKWAILAARADKARLQTVLDNAEFELAPLELREAIARADAFRSAVYFYAKGEVSFAEALASPLP